MREVETRPTEVVTRTFTVDEAGTVRKMVYESVPADATNDGTYLVTYNGHGDAVLLSEVESDGTLSAANRFSYTTWGTPATSLVGSYGDLGFRYRYVGAHDVQWDGYEGAGLLYLHARHYHPEFGRFLQPDPSQLEANHYAYAENNPTTKIDPSGEAAECVAIAHPGARLGCEIGRLVLVAGATFVATLLASIRADTLRRNNLTGKAYEAARIRDLRRDWGAVKAPTYFKTPFGGRLLDACVWDSSRKLASYLLSGSPMPRACFEFKSSQAAADSYYGNYSGQFAKDEYIQKVRRVPIIIVWSP